MVNKRHVLEGATTLAVSVVVFFFLFSLGPLIGQDLAFIISTTPFAGVLLRFRINYKPKASHIMLNNDGNLEQQAEAVENDDQDETDSVRGYLHMLRKTLQVEVRVAIFCFTMML